jgi:hypothetical protein
MRAEKKSRWRADVATPSAPHTLSEGVLPLRRLAIAFGAKQVRTRELKEPGEFTCSQRGFCIVIPKANWSFSRSFSKERILRTNSIGVMAAISNWSHDLRCTQFFESHSYGQVVSDSYKLCCHRIKYCAAGDAPYCSPRPASRQSAEGLLPRSAAAAVRRRSRRGADAQAPCQRRRALRMPALSARGSDRVQAGRLLRRYG